MAEESKPAEGQPQPPQQFPTEYSNLTTVYTNFCRVTLTAEEVVLDFGLNPHMAATPTDAVKLTHRVVMNFFTAKRLMNVLMNVIHQHESIYGTLELDYQKRARGAARPSAASRPGQSGGLG